MCKIEIQPQFLLDWFIKSLQPTIAKVVETSFPHSEEEAILKDQHFYLNYARSSYTILPDAPWHTSLYSPHARSLHSADGIIGSISQQGKFPLQPSVMPPPMEAHYPLISPMSAPLTTIPNPPFRKL